MFEVSAGEVISGACVVNVFEVSAGEVISGACVVNVFEVSADEVISGACVVNMSVVDSVLIIVSRSPCSRRPTTSQTQSIHAFSLGFSITTQVLLLSLILLQYC